MKYLLSRLKTTQKILAKLTPGLFPFVKAFRFLMSTMRSKYDRAFTLAKKEWAKPLENKHITLMRKYSPSIIPVLVIAIISPIVFSTFFVQKPLPIKLITQNGKPLEYSGRINHQENRTYSVELESGGTTLSMEGVSTPPEDLTIYVDKPHANDEQIVTNVLFVDDTHLAFKSASVELTVAGDKKPNAILTCSTWEFNTDAGTCSNWQIADIKPEQIGNTLAFNVDHFSAYAGAYLELLNVQTNLTKGDIWEKRFYTYGSSDLTVEGVEGTVYGTDVEHIEFYCGESKISQVFQEGKVFIENYNCDNQLSRLVDRSVTPGQHKLQLTFGDTVTVAKNFACDVGTLDDTCEVSTNQIVTNGTIISGIGNILIKSMGNIGASPGNAFSIDMDGNVTIESGGFIGGNLTNLEAANMDIQSGGRINVNGRGYSSSSGPGEGGDGSASNGGGGGGHGGYGGYGIQFTGSLSGAGGNSLYGSVTEPITYGSGGGNSTGSYPGGSGGGAVRLTILGTTTINGTIWADGNSGVAAGTTGYYMSGGGAGGSVYITTSTLAGSGSITANGGYGEGTSRGDAGGGGGGRVALHYTTKTFNGTLSVRGGVGEESAHDGGAGTIYEKQSGQEYGTLLLDNTGVALQTRTQLPTGSYTFDTLTVSNNSNLDVQDDVSIDINTTFVQSGAIQLTNSSSTGVVTKDPPIDLSFTSGTSSLTGNNNQWPINNITLSSGSLNVTGDFDNLGDISITNATLSLNGEYSADNLTIESGGTLLHLSNSTTQTNDLSLDLSGNLTLNSNGKIDVNGRGYSSANGTGKGNNGTSASGGGGGGYGGSGGNGNAGAAGGSSYGSELTPVDIGSGGGVSISAGGGAGGGSVIFNVAGTTTVGSSASITANGTNGGINSTNQAGGGGSGGTVYIVSETINGSGTISANGGNGGNNGTADGGGGGGGKLVVFSRNGNYSGTSTANGGVGPDSATDGAAGIYLVDTTEPVITSIDPVCEIEGNECTVGGSEASPQQAFGVSTLQGTITESDTPLHSLQISIKDENTDQWFNPGTNAFDQSSEFLFTPTLDQTLPYTGVTSWSYDSSGLPFQIDSTYTVSATAANAKFSNSDSLSFIFTNSPPEVTNITASQNANGTVSIGYDVTDNESDATTVRLFYDVGATLSSGMDTGTSDISLSDGAFFPNSGSILIDSEMISYTNKSGNTLSGISRGTLNTTNITHDSDSAVWILGPTTTGDTGSITNGTGKTISWTAKTDTNGFYSTTAKISVVANDGATSQMVDVGPSSPFTLDVKNPTWTTNFQVDGSQDDPVIVVPCSDDRTLEMKIGLSSDLSDVEWQAFDNETTIGELGLTVSDPFTIYGQCRDTNSNVSTLLSASTPDSPDNMFFQDISNSPTSEWREFVTWNVVDEPTAGFNRYLIYRKVDDGSFTQLTTLSDRNLNYIVDADLTTGSTYSYKVLTEDNQGNISYYSSTVTDSPEGEGGTDNTAPILTSVTATDVTSTQATVTWTSNELSDSTIYYVASENYPGSDISSYDNSLSVDSMVTSHSITLSNLIPNTKYYFLVTSNDAVDNVGNSASATYTFTTSSGPSISTVSTTSVFDSEATVTWQTNEAASSTVRYSTNSNLSGATTVNGTGNTQNHSLQLTELNPNTRYYFQVESTDTDGNQTIDKNIVNGSVHYYTFTTTSDTVGPVISNVTAALVGQEGITITWQTNEVATSQLLWGVDSNVENATTQTNVYTNFHSVTITNLTPETQYYYQVVSEDKSGNTTSSSPVATTTTDEVVTDGGDETAPSFSNIDVTDITSSSAVVTWITNENADSFVKYGTADDNLDTTIGRVESGTTHSVTLRNLSGSTQYYFAVIGRDEDGNFAESSIASFTTQATTNEELEDAAEEDNELISLVVDIVEKASKSFLQKVLTALINNPRITALPEDDVVALVEDLSDKSISAPSISTNLEIQPNAETAVVKWTTNKPANSLIAFATSADYNPDSSEPYTTEAGDSQAYTTSHEVTLVGLQPNTEYHIQARSKDRFGPVSESSDTTFTTTALTAEIQDLTLASANETSVLITWETTIPTRYTMSLVDTDTGEESIYSDNSYLKAHNFEAVDLSPSTSYIALITAIDENGEETISPPTPFSTITTSAPPQISDVKVVTSLISGKVEKVQSIISWKTDKPASSKVLYQQGVKTEGSAQEIVDETLKRDHIIITSAFTPGQVYQYNVVSSDIAGNTAESQNFTLLTPRPQESVVDLIVKNVEDMFGFLR